MTSLKMKQREWSATYRKRHPDRVVARHRVFVEVRAGRLPDPKTLACSDCGGRSVQYDHADYTMPLVVQPVCRDCHWRRERERGPRP